MRRRSGSPPPITPKQNDNIITQEREYEIITPLFGGGVNPGEADPITMVRGTEIRGQLRFWWRATRGGRPEFDGNLAKMKQEENNIWGAAYKKGDKVVLQEQIIQITVNVLSHGTRVELFDKRGRPVREPDAPTYAAFPLQPSDADKQAGNPPKAVQKGISFNLIISFPKNQQEEVEAALWAWENFGGIGGRTRRGFGALHLLKVDGFNNTDFPSSRDARGWIEKKLNTHVATSNFPDNLPHLSTNTQFNITRDLRDTMSVWHYLIKRLYDFRQDGRPERSNWPEATAIKQGTYKRDTNQHSFINKFPRAAFGLPIIFHFVGPQKNVPEDTTLQGDKIERLASPLLLRPLLCKDGKAVGLAVLLEGPRIPPGGLQLLEKGGSKPYPVDSNLTQKEAGSIKVLEGETDILQAFLKYL